MRAPPLPAPFFAHRIRMSHLRTTLSPDDEQLVSDVTKHLETVTGTVKQIVDHYELKIENLNNHIKLMADQQKRDKDYIKKLTDFINKKSCDC